MQLMEGAKTDHSLLRVAMALRRYEAEVQTRRLMQRLADLAHWPYIDLDAAVIKKNAAKAAKTKDE
jgi:hypothetical protein